MIYNLAKSYGYFLTLVCTILFSFVSLKSQEYIDKKGSVNIGFETGIQFTDIDDPYVVTSDGGVGYTAGPFIEYHITEYVKIRGGIEIDNRAFSLEDTGHIIDDSLNIFFNSYYRNNAKYRANYLTLPISMVYMKGDEKLNFYLQGTIYYSLHLNTNMTGSADIYISEEDAPYIFFEDHPELSLPGHHHYDVKPLTFNTSDMGINVRIGVIYNISPGLGVTLSPALTYSFSNVWEDPLRRATWTRLYKITAGIVYKLN